MVTVAKWRDGAIAEEYIWATARVLEPLGSGAFGDVFRAWDTTLDREVALKLLKRLLALSDIADGRDHSDTLPIVDQEGSPGIDDALKHKLVETPVVVVNRAGEETAVILRPSRGRQGHGPCCLTPHSSAGDRR